MSLEGWTTLIERRIDKALEVAFEYGCIDGDHHKMWVINEMVRILTGGDYERWIAKYENDGEYIWDIGIAP